MPIRTIILGAIILACAVPASARGGGGCLRAGTPVLTPDGPIPIERLQAGDKVLGVIDGQLKPAIVLACYEVAAQEFRELHTKDCVVLATPEHPFMTAAGVFRTAESLREGETLYIEHAGAIVASPLESVRSVLAAAPAYNLLVSPGGTFIAGGIVVHNKGCFLGDTPILRGDGSYTFIRQIKPGDELLAFGEDGKTVPATVRSVISLQVDEYLEVVAGSMRLEVTPEHPFYVGRGAFKTIESLAAGENVYVYDGKGLSPQPIVSIRRVHAAATVYSLQTDRPHTFFANGVAVHNKGGGCFPAGTLISTPAGVMAIECLVPGQLVYSIRGSDSLEASHVQEVFCTSSPLLILQTDAGCLRTTAEHPVLVRGKGFVAAGEIRAGEKVGLWRNSRLEYTLVQSIEASAIQVPVFNLTVSGPHTFIADGFIVHNKGGGGFGGGYHGGSGSSGGGDDMTWVLLGLVLFIYILVTVLKKAAQANSKEEQNLDYSYSPSAVEPKVLKTRKLLEFIARQDPEFTADKLTEVAANTFTMLQQCWQAREYSPMKDLLVPDLYAQHCKQIQGLIRDHEINMIESVSVQRADIVNVRYTLKPDQREFTVLISAVAKDYYVDDRTNEFLRGDEEPQPFQEFWTFQLQGGHWLLREIEQSRESDVLKEENFFEQMTDHNVNKIYGDAAGKEGAAGPWLEKGTQLKATRIERMLNFLVQTDKLWNRQQMLQRARDVFMNVYAAREAVDAAMVSGEDLFPDIAQSLTDEIASRHAKGTTIQFRNLCIRKAELILVRNYADNTKDEFTARISAHAQQVITQGGREIGSDPWVVPFEEYWTFGRMDNQWKLKEVLPPAQGQKELAEENLDEDSTPAQVQWYYRQTRAN